MSEEKDEQAVGTPETKDMRDLSISDEELASFESDEPYVPPKELSEEEQKALDEKTAAEEKEKLASEAKEKLSEEEQKALDEKNALEAKKASEEDSKKELVYETEDGVEHDVKEIETWRQDSVNKAEWQKSNTEKAQAVAEARKSIDDVAKLLADEEWMEANDDYFGSKKDNPLRKVDLDASSKLESSEKKESEKESKTEVEKRLETLEKEKVEREQAVADGKAKQKAVAQVEKEIDSLIELDPSLKDNSEKLTKIAEKALAMSEENPDEPAARLIDAWAELYGKNRKSLEELKGKKKDVSDETVSGKGAKEATYKTPPEDWDEASDRALKEYLNME